MSHIASASHPSLSPLSYRELEAILYKRDAGRQDHIRVDHNRVPRDGEVGDSQAAGVDTALESLRLRYSACLRSEGCKSCGAFQKRFVSRASNSLTSSAPLTFSLYNPSPAAGVFLLVHDVFH